VTECKICPTHVRTRLSDDRPADKVTELVHHFDEVRVVVISHHDQPTGWHNTFFVEESHDFVEWGANCCQQTCVCNPWAAVWTTIEIFNPDTVRITNKRRTKGDVEVNGTGAHRVGCNSYRSRNFRAPVFNLAFGMCRSCQVFT